MSDGLNISAAASFRPPEPSSNQSRLSSAVEQTDSAVVDLADATYISPVAELDVDTSLVLYRFRDTATGDVTRQFPSDGRIASYQNGTAISPTELSSFFANAEPSDGSAAAEQNADAIEQLQTAPELAQIAPTTAEADTSVATAGSEAPTAADISGPSVPTDTTTTSAVPEAPVTQTVVSGQPANGVSDVTDTGTDASAVGEGEIRTLATSS